MKAPLDPTRLATLAALSALHLRPYDRDKSAYSALVVGDTADGREITVSLKSLSISRTEVSLRIRSSRDRQKLERILAEINEWL